jgi:hypothetical protein
MKRGKEAAVISQLESYLILKIKALGHWEVSLDEYYSLSLLKSVLAVLVSWKRFLIIICECMNVRLRVRVITARVKPKSVFELRILSMRASLLIAGR